MADLASPSLYATCRREIGSWVCSRSHIDCVIQWKSSLRYRPFQICHPRETNVRRYLRKAHSVKLAPSVPQGSLHRDQRSLSSKSQHPTHELAIELPPRCTSIGCLRRPIPPAKLSARAWPLSS